MPKKLWPSFNINEETLKQLEKLVPEAFKDGMLDFNSLYDAIKDYNEEDSFDMDDNFYGLYWPGKRKAKREAAKPPRGTLIPVKGDGVNEENTKNIYIEGENLEVLKLMQKSYAGKVKMIYIDPPYNTGNDFVYNDDFSEATESFGKATGQIDEQGVEQVKNINSRAGGRFHSKWLSMMYPRLKLAHSLLQEDGVIFISIDDNEVAQLRKICDEIYGEENFVGCIANINNPKGRSDDKYLATAHEYLSVYAKNVISLEWYGFEPTDEIIRRYNKIDKHGNKYREIDLRKTGESDLREDRPNLFYYFHYNEQTGDYYPSRDNNPPAGYKSIFPQREDLKEGNWRWGLETAQKQILDLIPKFMPTRKIWGIMQKDYLSLRELIKPTSAWTFKDVNSERGSENFIDLGFEKRIFPKPKPVGTILRTIRLCSKQNDIILDFFSGSSTTAHAVMQLNAEDGGNRQFIMVQLPEKCDEKSEAFKSGFKNICEIGKERIRRAGKKIFESQDSASLSLCENSLDIGFKVYRTSASNYKKWQNYTGTDIQEAEDLFAQYENPLVDNWKEENLLTEIMLLEGFSLDSAVTIIKDFKKNKVTQISSNFCEHSLFICLDNTIHSETIMTLMLSEHDIFICLDNAVTDQDKARLDDKGLIKTI